MLYKDVNFMPRYSKSRLNLLIIIDFIGNKITSDFKQTQVDVYSFGHVLYEMAFGRPLLEATCSELPYCEAALKSLLEIILSPEALKQDLPTVSHLLEHPFFESARRAALTVGSINRKAAFQIK